MPDSTVAPTNHTPCCEGEGRVDLPCANNNRDTGLHVAMRALLGIIAGLIISDLLKNTVTSMLGELPPKGPSTANGFLLLAATIFVVRVLADNVIYYADRDATTGGGDDAYRSRIFLIIFDLGSYAFCYAIVLRLADVATGHALLFTAVVWTLVHFATVEGLHWLWCEVAFRMVSRRTDDGEHQRLKLLARWRRLSGEAAIGWLLAAFTAFFLAGTIAEVSRLIAAVVLALSLISAWRYLSYMRDQYLGREL